MALANMVANGRAFCVVQKPDWNGGHYCTVEPWDYDTKDFEYFRWYGTPLEYAEQKPTFDWHVEPFHGEPMDGEVDALTFLKAQLN